MPVDVLILTGLRAELQAVLALGDRGKAGWTEREDPGGLPYHVRSIPRAGGRPLELAAAWSTDMGEVAAVERSSMLARDLSPRWLAMCGICAGRRDDVSLGDVIVADRVFSYDHGKLIASSDPHGERQEEIFRDITTYNLREPWRTKVAYFIDDLSWSAELVARRPLSLERQSQWLLRTLLQNQDPQQHPDRSVECPDWKPTLQRLKKRGLIAYPAPAIVLTELGLTAAMSEDIEAAKAPPHDPPFRVHMGPIATGKTVRVDDKIFDRIKQFSRKAIGIEMEAAAIGYVAERLGKLALVAKAVSDYADGDKDDGFRAFACEASARFLLAFFLGQDLDDHATTGRTFYSTAGSPATASARPSPAAPPSEPTGRAAPAGPAPAHSATTAPGLGAHRAPAEPLPITPPSVASDLRSPARGTTSPKQAHGSGTRPPGYVSATPYQETYFAMPPTATPVDPHDAARSPAREPAPPPGARNPAARPPSLATASQIGIGSVLGSWRLVALLGEGGMGSVYRAEHVELGKSAAAKILRAELTRNPDIAPRFLVEARAAARIKHPGVVDIYDYAIHDSGAAYIIMELLDGESLDDVIRQRRIGEREAVSIARGISDALMAAHELGIVHRDLKPANVYLVNDRAVVSGKRVKVLDFGIAKLTSAEDDTNSTRPDLVMGSPKYMSPEQWRGASQVDARSDQYALGCVLFEMVSGRAPFMSDEFGVLAVMHMNEPPPRLGALATVSPALDRIVGRLLAKRASDRFATMDDVTRALSMVAGETLIAPPAGGASPRQPPAQSAARGDHGGSALELALPHYLHGDAPLVRRFLAHIADDYESIDDGTLRLVDPRVEGAEGYEFFALLLGSTSSGTPELGTMTFMQHVLPLEEHLSRLDREARKVVVVISDSFELGRGVREKILDYRNRFDALVVPLYLGELRKADRAGRLEALFMDRVADFQAVPDLYAASGPLSDPTRFFGMRQVLDQLIAELEEPERIVVVHGLPGSGKSSLVRMADYGMTAARFVRLPCGTLAPSAIPAKIIAALNGSGDRPQDLSRAVESAQRSADGRLVLVLDDADAWLEASLAGKDSEASGELWATLLELAHRRKMSTIATTVRGFMLGRPVRDGRPNPIAKAILRVEMPRLDRQTAGRLVRDLGVQMNVRVADRVVDECAELSGGNVDILRRLCSGMLTRRRRDATHHALRAVTLTRRDLRDTAADLIAVRGTFEALMPWLDATEQRVLHEVAVHLPHDPGDLANKDLPAREAGAVLDNLRLMGLVERVDSRDQLTIPLLASWAKRHLRGPRSGSRWLSWMR